MSRTILCRQNNSRAGWHIFAGSRGPGLSTIVAMIFIAMSMSVAPQVAAQEDAATDRLLASQCAQCHGTNGHAVGEMDSLAGDQDLFEDLADMLKEDHIEDVMEHQAHGYSLDQIERIARYYAGLHQDGEQERDEKDEEDEEDEEDEKEEH